MPLPPYLFSFPTRLRRCVPKHREADVSLRVALICQMRVAVHYARCSGAASPGVYTFGRCGAARASVAVARRVRLPAVPVLYAIVAIQMMPNRHISLFRVRRGVSR